MEVEQTFIGLFFYGPVYIEKRNIRQRPRQGNPAGTTFNINNASFPELGHDIADNDRIISYTAGQKITGNFITAGKIPDSRQYMHTIVFVKKRDNPALSCYTFL